MFVDYMYFKSVVVLKCVLSSITWRIGNFEFFVLEVEYIYQDAFVEPGGVRSK